MDITSLQPLKKIRKPRSVANSQTRLDFIKAFEQTFGNISAACEIVGITRPTYYRWMHSNASINKDFRAKLAKLQPAEKLVDFAEAGLMERIQAKDTTAIIFTLKTKGKHRGYVEKQSVEVELTVNDNWKRAVQALIEKGSANDIQEAIQLLKDAEFQITPDIEAALLSEGKAIG